MYILYKKPDADVEYGSFDWFVLLYHSKLKYTISMWHISIDHYKSFYLILFMLFMSISHKQVLSKGWVKKRMSNMQQNEDSSTSKTRMYPIHIIMIIPDLFWKLYW